MNVTVDQLRAICPRALPSVIPELGRVLDACQAVTHLRMAMVLAQLAVESDCFRAMVEYGGPGKPYAPYYGRTWIQLTGKANYRRVGKALDLNLVLNPGLALAHNVEIVSWFWLTNHLNDLADIGDVDAASRRINGGDNGLLTRRRYYETACSVLAGAHAA